MRVQQISVQGEDFIGLFGIATDKYAILSRNFPEVESLDVPVFRTSIYGTSLVAIFCSGNSNGLLLPHFVPESDINRVQNFFQENDIDVKIGSLMDNYTAIGNLIACNDKGAIVSPLLSDTDVIEDTLDVKAKKMDISGHNEVGACCVPTNKGFLAHPDTENNLERISKFLKVEGDAGSVNFGFPFVRSGLIANSNGYIAGSRTSGIELGRIDEALGFLD